MYAREVKRIFLLFFFVTFPIVVWADEVIFRWVDKQGATHITDRLGDVPEPYHSMYAAQLRELEEKKKASNKSVQLPVISEPTPNASSYSYGQGAGAMQDAQKKKWQALMLKWRAELQAATTGLFAVDDHLAELRLNPILRETPQVKKQIAELEAERSAAFERARAAEKMLLVELPKQAKKEGVPPKWLL